MELEYYLTCYKIKLSQAPIVGKIWAEGKVTSLSVPRRRGKCLCGHRAKLCGCPFPHLLHKGRALTALVAWGGRTHPSLFSQICPFHSRSEHGPVNSSDPGTVFWQMRYQTLSPSCPFPLRGHPFWYKGAHSGVREGIKFHSGLEIDLIKTGHFCWRGF